MESTTEQRINKQRQYWIDKIYKQTEEVMMASLDGDAIKHAKALDDLATSYIILIRFDNKLREERKEDGNHQV